MLLSPGFSLLSQILRVFEAPSNFFGNLSRISGVPFEVSLQWIARVGWGGGGGFEAHCYAKCLQRDVLFIMLGMYVCGVSVCVVVPLLVDKIAVLFHSNYGDSVL